MKARVKATGEIVEVVHYSGYDDYDYICHENESVYDAEELEFEDDIDYWTRLEHQYTGMAMQGLMSILPQIGGIKGRSQSDEVTDMSITIATKLIKKLKEERK